MPVRVFRALRPGAPQNVDGGFLNLLGYIKHGCPRRFLDGRSKPQPSTAAVVALQPGVGHLFVV